MQKIPYRLRRALKINELLDEKGGNFLRGEWEIILDPEEILKLEEGFSQKLGSKEAALSGVLAEDNFYIHTRMFYRRPVGKTGKTEILLYNRTLWKGRIFGHSGVALLIISSEGKIYLSRTWRPSINGWILEMPGTVGKEGESLDDIIARCVRDDVGLEIEERIILTDDYIPERGLLGGTVPLFLIKLRPGEPKASDASIAEHIAFTKEGLEKAIVSGKYNYKGIDHYICDGYLVTALFLAEKKKLI
jgi:ADP-ribose pyrophosphatase YjhB (NUDIX family)